jgi:hypothetical protein
MRRQHAYVRRLCKAALTVINNERAVRFVLRVPAERSGQNEAVHDITEDGINWLMDMKAGDEAEVQSYGVLKGAMLFS